MKRGHILDILDSKNFFDLTESEKRSIETHTEYCGECRHAADASRLAAELMEARMRAEIAPAPSAFFIGKVMNAVQARRGMRTQVEAFRKWWQASYSLVSVLVVVVFVLVLGAIFAPTEEQETLVATPSNLYPAETVLIDHRPSRELNKEQVFQVIYNTRFEGKK